MHMHNVLIGVFLFMSFFVRFLVFELWSIFYLTVFNSALGLSVTGFANLFKLGSSLLTKTTCEPDLDANQVRTGSSILRFYF